MGKSKRPTVSEYKGNLVRGASGLALTLDGVTYASKAKWDDEDDADAFVNAVLDSGRQIKSGGDFENGCYTLWFSVL